MHRFVHRGFPVKNGSFSGVVWLQLPGMIFFSFAMRCLGTLSEVGGSVGWLLQDGLHVLLGDLQDSKTRFLLNIFCMKQMVSGKFDSTGS